MQNDSKKSDKTETTNDEKANPKKEYRFGSIEEFSLEKIEESILEESLYLDVFAGSDLAFKNNIQPLENVLPLIANLNCIKYDYNTDLFKSKNFPETRQVGVIAQEINQAFPELIRNDNEGDMQVNYSQLSTIALQAVKELSVMLQASNERILLLEKEMTELKKK